MVKLFNVYHESGRVDRIAAFSVATNAGVLEVYKIVEGWRGGGPTVVAAYPAGTWKFVEMIKDEVNDGA